MGDFANYTIDSVKNRKDLASTHNNPAGYDLTRGAASNQTENKIAVFVPRSCTMLERRMILDDIEFDNAVLITMVKLSNEELRGRRVIMIKDITPAVSAELKNEQFDLVVFPFGEKLGDVAIESIVSGFCQRVLAVFSNGKKRFYEGNDFNRLLYNAAYLRSMFRHLPTLRNKRVLEVGCSDQLAADIVANERPGFIIAVDVTPYQTSKFSDPLVTYAQMDAHSLEFADATFDVCYSIATLEHCRDPFAVMQEIKRVLRPGGYAYIQAAPLYYSPFGHHMFGYFDDVPWIHLRKSEEQIIAYCYEHGIDSAIKKNTGNNVENYIRGMLNPQHVNGKTLAEYRLDEFIASGDLKVIFFAKSYEGNNLLTPSVLNELPEIPPENLVLHGFELVFQIIRRQRRSPCHSFLF